MESRACTLLRPIDQPLGRKCWIGSICLSSIIRGTPTVSALRQNQPTAKPKEAERRITTATNTNFLTLILHDFVPHFPTSRSLVRQSPFMGGCRIALHSPRTPVIYLD